MTTTITNRSKPQNRDALPNILMVTVLILVFVGVFFLYVLPAMRGNTEPTADNSTLSIEGTARVEDTTLSSTENVSSQ